jgi:hypothetical protein
MNGDKENQLLDLVNASGYPLQIGIEEEVRKTQSSHKLQKPEQGAQLDRSKAHTKTGAWRTLKPG